MENEQLETVSLKNEYTITLIKIINNDWAKIVKVPETDFHSENQNIWRTFNDVMHASSKIGNLLNLTLDMLEEADYSNDQALEYVIELNRKVK